MDDARRRDGPDPRRRYPRRTPRHAGLGARAVGRDRPGLWGNELDRNGDGGAPKLIPVADLQQTQAVEWVTLTDRVTGEFDDEEDSCRGRGVVGVCGGAVVGGRCPGRCFGAWDAAGADAAAADGVSGDGMV